ncbi:MAG: hypothetical protein ABS76_26230 [Pelagibacterium sp. SCN 64-44]|nr:MAG: hypothetical protein ABS76_26230 [Pelagibacterium sp. SCN 64-44]
MRRFLVLGLCLLLPLFTLAPASALSLSGSHAWSRGELDLRAGPGGQYKSTGAIPAKVAIKVLRCVELWCLVDGPGAQGWAARQKVDFGRGPGYRHPDLTGGQMCFYEGTHYTGRSFCAGTGQVFTDLATWGWDNRIGSIAVKVNTSAAICRERDFRSYCERVHESQPVLSQHLQRQVSSIRLY